MLKSNSFREKKKKLLFWSFHNVSIWIRKVNISPIHNQFIQQHNSSRSCFIVCQMLWDCIKTSIERESPKKNTRRDSWYIMVVCIITILLKHSLDSQILVFCSVQKNYNISFELLQSYQHHFILHTLEYLIELSNI